MQTPVSDTVSDTAGLKVRLAANRSRILLVGTLLFVYVLIQSYAITRLTINYDEESFLQYGITLLKGERNKDIGKFESKLPITVINALPRAIEQLGDTSLKKQSPVDDIIAGRFLSLAVSILLALLIYTWTVQWYGSGAGLYALIFYLLCPNFLAHGIFVSSDIYACLFMAFTMYFFSRFMTAGKTKDFLAFSFSFALGQVSKFSLLHMFAVVVLIYLLVRISGKKRTAVFTKRNIVLAGIFLLVTWVTISGTHLFYDVFFPLNHYEYQSSVFQRLVEVLGGLSAFVYIPLPSSYVRSIDMVMYFDQLGGGVSGALNGKPYILGQYSIHGFWYYYFVSFFYKVPVPFIIIVLSSIVLYIKNRKRVQFLEQEIFLLAPVIYYLVYMSFFYSTQVGIRHILIIFPLLFVFSGYLFQKIIVYKKQFVILSLAAWQLISVALYFPHFLPYTNEFITDKKNAYKKIADTNLCYREGRRYLNEFLVSNKNAVYDPTGPIDGIVVVEINDYLGIQDDSKKGRYDWLSGVEPVGHIHSQYLIFDVTSK